MKNNLKSVRKRLGLTQSGLALAVGVSQGNISHCETQRQELSPEIAVAVVRLAKNNGVHISLDDIYLVDTESATRAAFPTMREPQAEKEAA
jgi:DNA-binding XRE family transcriptional regulator